MPVQPAPSNRLFVRINGEARNQGRFVLYWMQIHRRLNHNHALQHAAHLAESLDLPLLVYEGLRPDYPHASFRFHSFILDGMAEHWQHFEKTGGLLFPSDLSDRAGSDIKSAVQAMKALPGAAHYLPFVAIDAEEAKGFLANLCKHAAAVVSDEFPAFIVPGQNRALMRQLQEGAGLPQGDGPPPFVTVDANGIIPLQETQSDPYSAYIFRKTLQKKFARCFADFPEENPIRSRKKKYPLSLPDLDLPRLFLTPLLRSHTMLRRWSRFSLSSDVESRGAIRASEGPANPEERREALSGFGLDDQVGILSISGSSAAARAQSMHFIEQMHRYPEQRNHPDAGATSGLSPYLHFGKISIHEVVRDILGKYDLEDRCRALVYNNGSRGFFPGPPEVDAFLDEALTWRETGYHFCHHRTDFDKYESLPDWALRTLKEHQKDKREHLYDLSQLESASTYDEIWNAAQRELMQAGRIHNYLRMLWGKKILEWSKSPKQALETALHLNNKYSIDGRNPNSYSGVFWIFGRFDRPWQERDVFGKIRYMSSEQTRKKVRLKEYLERFGNQGTLL
ncbi:MAG: hypothetical protein KDK23_00995 [Leptospiraceae bacterium]|nr:hypothetical protein [Leptospiraceae bacterium]